MFTPSPTGHARAVSLPPWTYDHDQKFASACAVEADTPPYTPPPSVVIHRTPVEYYSSPAYPLGHEPAYAVRAAGETYNNLKSELEPLLYTAKQGSSAVNILGVLQVLDE